MPSPRRLRSGPCISLLVCLILWASASSPARAQLGSDDLLQLCAPIALYPDPLLSNVLAASTYPDEVVAADQWMHNAGPTAPSAINSRLAGQGWDPTVKTLVAFPSVLDYMASNMDWTVALGNAFLAQPSDLFGTIQGLRLQAQSCGNLGSNNDQLVTNDGGAIVIEPANPYEIYVPTYNPQLVYYQSGLALGFGAGILINNYLWTGVPDWTQNRLYFGQGYNSYYRGRGTVNNTYYTSVRASVANNQGVWRLNTQHRGGRAVPTAAQLSPGRGYPARAPVVNSQTTYPQRVGRGQPVAPANQPRPQTTYQRPATGPQRATPTYQPQVRSAAPPTNSNLPSGFNVRAGSNVNQEAQRGAQSRNQPRPMPVAPMAQPVMSRPSAPPSRPQAPPSRPAPSGGNKGRR